MKPDASLMPQIIKDALLNDLNKDEGKRNFEYSATVLCKTPRQVQLEKRHKDELDTPEILRTWYTFTGDAFHDYLERNLKNNPRYICERRIIRFDKPTGSQDDKYRRVGAKFDAYDKELKTLYDHKTTTTFIHGKEIKKEWVQQLMINAYFLMSEGYEVEVVSINAIYVDWRESKLRYAKEGDYPLSPAIAFSVPCWTKEECEFLYLSLLKQHIDAEDLPDDELPPCDSDYCWETTSKVAVYKEGGAKAIRLLDSYEDAIKYIKWKHIDNAKIEVRPAERRRCKNYCEVNKFCNQYQTWLQSQEHLANNEDNEE